jgi:hypothetical protein
MHDEISNIFLLNPPHSGSTAMAAVLLTAPRAWSATPNAEGQWVPEVSEEMRRRPWDPAVDFDWEHIKQRWFRLRPSTRTLLIEKSPPNLLRAASIMKVFNPLFVISNRNPYANIASILRTYFAHEDRDSRRNEIQRLARMWLFRSERQISNITLLRTRSVITTYETFCLFPNGLCNNLYNFCGDLRIDVNRHITVKNYPKQPIINMNNTQIAALSSEDIAIIDEVLLQKAHVVEFFGYRILGRQ